MSHQMDLTLFGAPKDVECPYCDEMTSTWFDDYTVGNTSLNGDHDLICDECDEEFVINLSFHVTTAIFLFEIMLSCVIILSKTLLCFYQQMLKLERIEMGTQINLCRFGAPSAVDCPYCGESTSTWFYDFDMDCSDPNGDHEIRCRKCDEYFTIKLSFSAKAEMTGIIFDQDLANERRSDAIK